MAIRRSVRELYYWYFLFILSMLNAMMVFSNFNGQLQPWCYPYAWAIFAVFFIIAPFAGWWFFALEKKRIHLLSFPLFLALFFAIILLNSNYHEITFGSVLMLFILSPAINVSYAAAAIWGSKNLSFTVIITAVAYFTALYWYLGRFYLVPRYRQASPSPEPGQDSD